MRNDRNAARWSRHVLLAPLALVFLTAWTGGSGDKGGSTPVSGTTATAATTAGVAQPPNTGGRLLAANCFQCHGTGGTGGFDKICGSSDLSGELAEFRQVMLASGATLAYDRLVIAPGVEFDNAYGLTQSDYETKTPHAWQAGAQTPLLRNQLAGMPSNGIFVMAIPAKPYRCPPGPYERACLVADYLKKNKGTGSRVIVLDQNLPLAGDTNYSAIQAERHTFETAFTRIHACIIDYRAGVSGIAINRDSRAVVFTDGAGTQSIAANVVNPIPPHRAAGSNSGGLLQKAGLANSGNARWAGVNVLSYESTALNAVGIHVLGDAADTGMPKAGHIANQEAKICADAIVCLFQNQALDSDVVANSACYSPITASTASWLTAVYQYVPPVAPATLGSMKVAGLGGVTSGGAPIESATISGDNFEEMNIWFRTLMGDTFA